MKEKTCTKCGQVKPIDCFYLRYGKAGTECKECTQRQSGQWKKRNREKHNEITRKSRKKFGRFHVALIHSKHTAKKEGFIRCLASKSELEAAFTGRCTICDIHESEVKRSLHMDHDHETGKFRGWLCSKCNHALGLMNDSSELLSKAIKYLDSGKDK